MFRETDMISALSSSAPICTPVSNHQTTPRNTHAHSVPTEIYAILLLREAWEALLLSLPFLWLRMAAALGSDGLRGRPRRAGSSEHGRSSIPRTVTEPRQFRLCRFWEKNVQAEARSGGWLPGVPATPWSPGSRVSHLPTPAQEPPSLVLSSEASRAHITSMSAGLLDLRVLSVRGLPGHQRSRVGHWRGRHSEPGADGGPLLCWAWEAVVGSSQPAPVAGNVVAPLCACHCCYVHGGPRPPRTWSTRAGSPRHTRTRPQGAPHSAPGCPTLSPGARHTQSRHRLLKERSSDTAMKNHDLFTKPSTETLQGERPPVCPGCLSYRLLGDGRACR